MEQTERLLGPVPRQNLRASWLSDGADLFEETLTYFPEQDTWLSDGAEYSETDLQESFRRGWLVNIEASKMTPDDLHRYLQTLLGDRSLTPEAVFLEIDKLVQALQRITTAMRLADPLVAVKCAERVGVAHVFWYELMELLDLKYGTDVVPTVRSLLGPSPRTKTEG